MKRRNRFTGITGMTCLCCLVVLAVLAVGCKKQPGEPATPTEAKQAIEFANVRCPIMNTPLDVAKVPASLTRSYKGKNVAFCCAACPTAWDKLSDTDKDAKLAKVMRK